MKEDFAAEEEDRGSINDHLNGMLIAKFILIEIDGVEKSVDEESDLEDGQDEIETDE